MLFKASKLKTVMKSVWKTTGLVVGMRKGFLYLAGDHWTIAIEADRITKEIKGAIIELVGDLPVEGGEFISYKGSNQEQFGFAEQFAIWEMYWTAQENHDICDAHNTNMVVSNEDRLQNDIRIFTCEDGTAMTVLEKIYKMIDYSELTEDECMEADEVKIKAGEEEMLLWATDICFVAARNIDYDEEQAKYIEAIRKVKAEG